MAEAIFNKMSEDNNLGHKAISRGVNVFFPQSINPKSLASLKSICSVDYENHKSQQLTVDDVKDCDLILTMTASHKMMLKNHFPQFKSKIYTLNEKAYGKDSDIDDPFGCDQAVYDKCCSAIQEAVGKILCLV